MDPLDLWCSAMHRIHRQDARRSAHLSAGRGRGRYGEAPRTGTLGRRRTESVHSQIEGAGPSTVLLSEMAPCDFAVRIECELQNELSLRQHLHRKQ